MHNFHLPDPTMSLSHGMKRESMETIVNGRRAYNVQHEDNHPLQYFPNALNIHALYASDMERKASISSVSSNSSEYTCTPAPSRCISPVGTNYEWKTSRNGSPSTGTALFSNIPAQLYASAREHHISSPRGTKSRIGKATKQRTVHQAKKPVVTQKEQKKMKERKSRYVQTVALSRLQNILLKMNPNLIQTAAPGVDHEHVGWSELKKNNITDMIAEKESTVPLMHNKVDVIDTGNLSLQQLWNVTGHGSTEIQALAALLAEPGCSPDRMAMVCDRMTQLCSHFEFVRAHVGERVESIPRHSQPKL
ncbi:hypothetical protein BKA63DRAFT_5772 [Paraphoma chrysanthemicola]|nr:hypothetical protein BKA63DRAFT_5772 [Paraphoma chrysanthemicola]